jgi:hypothetical protein
MDPSQSERTSARLNSWNFSFGKQDLWWSPTYGSSFLFSNNAEPIYMFRLSRVRPFTLPWIFRYIGPMKIDLFVGRMRGNDFPSGPIFHGEKISFKPTKNLQFGFSRTTEFGGEGRAAALGAISTAMCNDFGKFSPNDNPGLSRRSSISLTNFRLSRLADLVCGRDDQRDRTRLTRRAAAIDGGVVSGRGFSHPNWICVSKDSSPTPQPHGVMRGNSLLGAILPRRAYTNNKVIMGSWIGREEQSAAWQLLVQPKGDLNLDTGATG